MKMEKYIEDLLKDYKGISYEIIEITTDEDESFKVIDLHSDSLDADESLDFLFNTIVNYTFENRLYEYLCNLYFYEESEEYQNQLKTQQDFIYDCIDFIVEITEKKDNIIIEKENDESTYYNSDELEMVA